MWIDTFDGDLLNLDHVSRLFVGTDRTDRRVCLYARLDEKKDVGAAHIDILLGVFPVDASHPVEAATEHARQQLLQIRHQLRGREQLLEMNS